MSHVGERPDRPNAVRRLWTAVRTMRREDRRGIVILIGVLVAAAALVMSGLMIFACMLEVPRAAIALHHDTHLRAVSSVQPGTVVRIRETDHVGYSDYTEYVPWVRTEVGGRTETVLMRDDSADEPGVYRVGQRVEVMIDPAHPDEPRLRTEWLRADRAGYARYWTIVLAVSLVVFVPIMTVFVRWVRRNTLTKAERQEERLRAAAARIEARERDRRAGPRAGQEERLRAAAARIDAREHARAAIIRRRERRRG